MPMLKTPSIKMPGTSKMQMPSPLINVTLNPEIFEQQIKSQGVRMIHARPVPCPKVDDINGAMHSPSCNSCYNGFLYYNEKNFTGAFMNNTSQRQFQMNGTWDFDQANIIVPTKDSDGGILDVQFFDQIIVPDFTVRYYQRIEHSQSGFDKAQFEVVSIDFVIDKNGVMYLPGVDCIPERGGIKWISNKRPGYDPLLQRGVVYSVNYYTRPRFTVIQLPHQFRIAQTQSIPGQPNIEARFPQLVSVRKDFIPFDQSDKVGPPDRPEPRSGSF